MILKVTEYLSWSSHTAEVASKGNRTLGFLHLNFREYTREINAARFIPMVKPVLEYASFAWHPHRQGDIKFNADPSDMCAMTTLLTHRLLNKRFHYVEKIYIYIYIYI